MPFGRVSSGAHPHGAVGGEYPRRYCGGGVPHPAGHPRDFIPPATLPALGDSLVALSDHVSLVVFFPEWGRGETPTPPPEETPSRKQEGAAGINIYSKASLVQAPHPEVGRRASGGRSRPRRGRVGTEPGPRGGRPRPPRPPRSSLPPAAFPCARV